jgi:uncharacterized peroxidase-related enzyme
MTGSFLAEPPVSAQTQELYDEDLAESGYVWNVSRLWAYQPDTMKQLFALMSQAFKRSGLSFRQRGILVVSAASAFGDSYCTLAWSGKLGQAEDHALVAAVLDGSGTGLTDQEKALAAWARKVARDPNGTDATDVQALREAGFDDGQIFAVTAFLADQRRPRRAARRAARPGSARGGARGRDLRPARGGLSADGGAARHGGAAQNRQRVAPPGSTVLSAVAVRGVRR